MAVPSEETLYVMVLAAVIAYTDMIQLKRLSPVFVF